MQRNCVSTCLSLMHGHADIHCASCMQIERLPVFWKQRQMLFFDAFSFAFPAFLQRIPYSLFVSLIWTAVTYFPVGLAPEPSRFQHFAIPDQ